MKALVAINPKSGNGKGAQFGARLRRHFANSADEITFVEARSREESLLEIENALDHQHFELLISVGGDGFVHDLLPLLLKFDLPVLVLPAGSGNDFARSLGTYNLKYEEALTLPITRPPSRIDVGIISHEGRETPFVQILSTGFDSVVNERANNFKMISGKNKYVIAVLAMVWKFRAIHFTITIDGIKQERQAMLVCIANGSSYGAGMKIVPQAVDDDGLLNVMVVDQVNPLRLLMVFPRVFFGRHVNHPKVHFFTGSEITVTGKTKAYADGESISDLPIHVRLSDRSLQVFRA